MRRIANWLMPIVARNATVWPSMHAQHAGLLEDIKALHGALEGLVERVEWDVPPEERSAAMRGALLAAHRALDD